MIYFPSLNSHKMCENLQKSQSLLLTRLSFRNETP